MGQVIRVGLLSGCDMARAASAAMKAICARRVKGAVRFNAVTNHYIRSLARYQGFSLVTRRSKFNRMHGYCPAILFKNEQAFMLFKLRWCYRD